ncbi:MAG: hypothetical protein Pars2KO_25590 [Parasphingorhabdus sp.]
MAEALQSRRLAGSLIEPVGFRLQSIIDRFIDAFIDHLPAGIDRFSWELCNALGKVVDIFTDFVGIECLVDGRPKSQNLSFRIA